MESSLELLEEVGAFCMLLFSDVSSTNVEIQKSGAGERAQSTR